MNLTEIREEFRRGRINRDTYLALMYEKECALQECAALLKDSAITCMEIKEENVIVENQAGIRLNVDFSEFPAGIALRLLNLGEYENQEFDMAQQIIEDIGNGGGYMYLI